MVNLSILCFVCFLVPLNSCVVPGVFNTVRLLFFFKNSIIIYIYFRIIRDNHAFIVRGAHPLEPIRYYPLIKHLNLRNLLPYGTGHY